MVEKIVKQIPSKGSRAKGARYLAIFSIIAWVASILMVKVGWFTVQDAGVILWTTEYMKWGLTTSFVAYAASETGVKAAEAYMNRE